MKINEKNYTEIAIKANEENKVIFINKDGEYELVDNEIYLTSNYIDGEWIGDENKILSTVIQNNQLTKDALLQEANQQIAVLQDAIDLDMAEESDEAKLKAWKKYRILLNKIDAALGSVKLPQKPIS